MSVVINTNSAAIVAKNNLNSANSMLQKSLNRLSSGSKIVAPSDDAGGLAVSMKMSAAIKRNDAVNTNLANAKSFLQTQDGGFQTATKILDRMSELKTLSEDVTKNTSDKANYQTEFSALQNQLSALTSETFNGVSLFGASGNAGLSVKTTEDGGQSVTVSKAALASNLTGLTEGTSATSLGATALSTITGALQSVATMRAANGAQSSRLQFASDMLTVNKQNLEAANSRIIDVDVASESTQLARYNILVQAGSSMLSQANSSTQIALRLLG